MVTTVLDAGARDAAPSHALAAELGLGQTADDDGTGALISQTECQAASGGGTASKRPAVRSAVADEGIPEAFLARQYWRPWQSKQGSDRHDILTGECAMVARPAIPRTAVHVLLALLFALAALAFGEQALDAWNAKHTLRLVIAVLATLGAASLAVRRLRHARQTAAWGDSAGEGPRVPSA